MKNEVEVKQESKSESLHSGLLPFDFVIWLTGHDKKTIEQMYNDWNKCQ